jgi:hypothetical protein
MNGLGFAAFDADGKTAWRELSLPVDTAGDIIQIDATVANVADEFFDSQVVLDFIAEHKLELLNSH